MNLLFDRLDRHAKERPAANALCDATQVVTYGELPDLVTRVAAELPGRTVGLLVDNSPSWLVLDLAAQLSNKTIVPLPDFFTDQQLRHLILRAGIDVIVTDQKQRVLRAANPPADRDLQVAGATLQCFCLTEQSLLSDGIAKITFTSGTTNQPKGVCLNLEPLIAVARDLAAATGAGTADRILSVLPLSTLLENVAAYAGLLSGACCCLPALGTLGVSLAGVDSKRFVNGFAHFRPSALVLVPQLLKLLVVAAENHLIATNAFRFVAVGGSAVAPRLIKRARAAGLPVYEGYGLSEAGSVVCLNQPGAEKAGSVGRPLPHARIKIAADGEVLIGGSLFRGYIGDANRSAEYFPTGDLGRLDGDGYLYLSGRKKNLIITSFGRNFSPEWPESELLAESPIASAAVFGDARPFNVALIVPAANAAIKELNLAVAAANARLPVYAQVHRFHIVPTGFSAQRGELTANGRPRRARLALNYREEIERFYEETIDAVL
jgi:long-chain acyl-CoA synthetase